MSDLGIVVLRWGALVLLAFFSLVGTAWMFITPRLDLPIAIRVGVFLVGPTSMWGAWCWWMIVRSKLAGQRPGVPLADQLDLREDEGVARWFRRFMAAWFAMLVLIAVVILSAALSGLGEWSF